MTDAEVRREAADLLRRHRDRVSVLDRPRSAWAKMEIPPLEAVRKGASMAALDAAAVALDDVAYYNSDNWLVNNWPAPLAAIARAIRSLEAADV